MYNTANLEDKRGKEQIEEERVLEFLVFGNQRNGTDGEAAHAPTSP